VAVAPLITQADLELRFGAGTVRRFADDDGVGGTVADVVAGACVEATAIGLGILRRAFTSEAVATLASEDPSVSGALCDVAIALLARRRPEFLGPDGRTLYSSTRAEAERVLGRIADRDVRPDGERVAGPNRTVGTRTNRTAADLQFQASSVYPKGRGGF
jgi:hypothetical protein